MATKKKKKSSKFLAGVSGNPAGRPKGSKNQITLLKQSLELQLREQAAPNLAGVLDKAFELALDGNASMIKMLLELHMSKSNNDDTAKGGEKTLIQINSAAPNPVVSVIDVSPETITEED